jgi:thiol-disulfide isomerase/thioredoxin
MLSLAKIISPAISFAKKNGALLVIALAVLAAVVYYMKNRRLISGFQGGNDTPTLYFVYGDWCPHCKPLKQPFSALGNSVNVGGKQVNCEMIESAEKDKLAALNYEVRGYPTFLLDVNGQKEEVQPDGERTIENILATVKEMLGA